MKKFFIKAAVFAVITAFCIGVCNWGCERTDPFGTNKFKEVPDEIDICNMGASHSLFSFNYEEYNDRYTTFNFGLESQSHVYDYRILEYYKENFRKDGKTIVFIVVSYPMILGHDETESETFESKNRRYYTFLPPELIRKYDWETHLKLSLVPFIYGTSVRSLISGILKGKSATDTYWLRVTTPEDAAKDAQEAYERHVGGKKEGENGDVVYNQQAIDALYDMIKLCKEEGAMPILITPPFTADYSESVKNGAPEYYYNGFHNVLSKIQKDTGVEYYDYSEDDRFASDYSKFMNSDHLNKTGAREFTRIVMEEVLGDRLKNFD